ncbi:MAG: threonine--tRNA ligase [Candidatus Bathyarchaeota archaeon]|nr:threonine--tRNA ligase [Candidatus Bathyarchaeota archaeon]
MKIETIRHSLSHILASAVQDLFPGVKFGIGPSTEVGFYYDFDLPKTLTKKDLPKLEKRMKEFIKRNLKFEKKKVSIKKAKELFKKLNQPYKLDILKKGTEDFNPKREKSLTVYQLGNFIDLCKGPHVRSTKKMDPKSFKLTKVSGAYWRSSEKNPMLQRIYGIAFETPAKLKNFLLREKEAQERDHRKIGQALNLFSFDEDTGAGLPLWHPKGALLYQIIQDYWRKEHLKRGYQLVRTPHIGREELFEKSGHLDFYKENMYSPFEIENEKYYIKPMNCPFHMKIYNSRIRSYRDLPLRLAEMATVYRFERSGVLHGLVRVRGFTQDDAHIFCTPEQFSKELIAIIRFAFEILKAFGFKNFDVYISTRPKKYIGIVKKWQKATSALKYALERLKISYQIDPGEGVFYGPKIDIKIKDSLGREWQCTTIQVDFNLPERFDIFYIDKKGRKQKPIMIHRTPLGSLERFIGVLLEHYAGALPFWLSPEQVWITPLGKKHFKYAQKINGQLSINNLRTVFKDERETVSKKIREGEIQRIPYILVVGDKEMKNKTIRVRERNKGDIGEMKIETFIKKIGKTRLKLSL